MNKLNVAVAAVVMGALILSGCGSDSEVTLVEMPVTPLINALADCGVTTEVNLDSAFTLVADFRTVIMGSSSAAGAGASAAELSWAGQFASWQQQKGRETLNLAIGGATTYQGLPDYCLSAESRMPPDTGHNVSRVLAEQADLVLISYPSNDAALGWAAEESVANILLVRSVLAEAGIASVVLAAQPRNMSSAKVAKLREFDRLLQLTIKDCVVPLYDVLQQNDRLNPEFDAGDGVHINDKGHALVFAALSNMLAQGQCVTLPE